MRTLHVGLTKAAYYALSLVCSGHLDRFRFAEMCFLTRQSLKAVLHGSTGNIDFPSNTVSCFRDMLHESTFCATLVLDFFNGNVHVTRGDLQRNIN